MPTPKQRKAVERMVEKYKRYGGRYLYLIRCNEFYKIGIAYDIDNRLNSLQTGNPYELDILFAVKISGAEKVEELLHNYFKDKRIFREWFKLEQDDIKFILSIENDLVEKIG
jgi:hypothetical protein